MFTYIESLLGHDVSGIIVRVSLTSQEVSLMIESLHMLGFGEYTVLDYNGDIVKSGKVESCL